MTSAARKIPAEILLVEDDKFLRQLYYDGLSLAGYNVDVAVNGSDALGKLSGKGYDLVITDMKMPVLGGLELYLRSMDKYPELKDRFLFMSGDSSWDYNVTPCLVARRIQKPFKIKELLAQVNALAG